MKYFKFALLSGLIVCIAACEANRRMDALYNPPAAGPKISAEAKPFRPNPHIPTVDLPFLRQGRRNFEVHCRLCHGDAGFGDGHIPRHGFEKSPPSYHSAEALKMDVTKIFTVAKHGKGIMFGFGDRLQDSTLWSIAHYVKVLQLAFHFPVEELTEAEHRQLEAAP